MDIIRAFHDESARRRDPGLQHIRSVGSRPPRDLRVRLRQTTINAQFIDAARTALKPNSMPRSRASVRPALGQMVMMALSAVWLALFRFGDKKPYLQRGEVST